MAKLWRAKWIAAMTAAAAAAVAAAYCVYQNNCIEVTELTYRHPKVPGAFDDFRIAVVADLHGKQFGPGQEKLAGLLEKSEPDLIAVIGDLIDCRRRHLVPAVTLIERAAKIAPVCYVPGNHEGRAPHLYKPLKEALREAGVMILEDQKETLYRDGAVIELIGLRDPDFTVRGSGTTRKALQIHYALKTAAAGPTSNLRILLSHRPELAEVYCANGVDLALTGHAHGGQWRLPDRRGLFAPSQGFLPRLVDGAHQIGTLTLLVSRGLGNSCFPVRINNRPELIMVTLTGQLPEK